MWLVSFSYEEMYISHFKKRKTVHIFLEKEIEFMQIKKCILNNYCTKILMQMRINIENNDKKKKKIQIQR